MNCSGRIKNGFPPLLCLITKWAHALLKKAKSSDIGSNVASLCCSTLAFLMDSTFNDNESFFRTAKKMCTSLLKRENNREFVIDILKSIWHSCKGHAFFPTTGKSPQKCSTTNEASVDMSVMKMT